MVFSDTSAKGGIIQEIEFWTNLGDAGVSGNATLLKVMTARVNRGFDKLMPYLMSWSDTLKWDDLNYSDTPTATVNIVSGTNGYQTLEDAGNLDILNVTNVRILNSANATQYTDLERMTLDDPRVPDAIVPNSLTTGVPTHFLEKGNTIYLYPNPNYSVSNGIQLFFEREQSYFASTDTTKQPGIPKPFHQLLPLYASYDWLIINKPAQTMLITRIEAEIAKEEQNLKDIIAKRNPTKSRLTTSKDSNK